jgi:hypothetical protein
MDEHGEATPETDPRDLVKADASNRGWRTFVQGLVAAALVAIAAVMTDVLIPGVAVDWPQFGLMTLAAVLAAAGAYLQRRLEK